MANECKKKPLPPSSSTVTKLSPNESFFTIPAWNSLATVLEDPTLTLHPFTHSGGQFYVIRPQYPAIWPRNNMIRVAPYGGVRRAWGHSTLVAGDIMGERAVPRGHTAVLPALPVQSQPPSLLILKFLPFFVLLGYLLVKSEKKKNISLAQSR